MNDDEACRILDLLVLFSFLPSQLICVFAFGFLSHIVFVVVFGDFYITKNQNSLVCDRTRNRL